MSVRRGRTVQLRVSDEEYEEFKALSAAQKMNVSEWLRYLASQESMDIQQATGGERSTFRCDFRFTGNRQCELPAAHDGSHRVGTETEWAASKADESHASIDEKAFKRKVAQIMGKENCSQEEAERKVREELG